MMDSSSYWSRFWRRRLSRRRLLGGAALTGGGLAAAAVVGCSSDSGNGNGPKTTPTDVERLIDGRRVFGANNTLTKPAPAGMDGGTLRFSGFDPVVLDRYDPHQTQFGPMYANQSAVFSKLYMYKSHAEPTWENIIPDVAAKAPEMIGDPPDEYVIQLRRGVKFQNSENIRKNFPDLAGRELTADDVIFSFERQVNRDSPQYPYYYRSSQYGTIESIKKVDDYTIRIKTKGPVAPFYHFLADTNAMIVPKEIVDMEPGGPDDLPWDSVDSYRGRGVEPSQRMIGSGPFMWGNLVWGIEFTATRNPEWFGWDEPELKRPYLDGYQVSGQVVDDSTAESLFREKKLDSAGFVDNPGWIFSIKDEMPELSVFMGHTSGWVNSRLKLYCPPFNDWRVRKALHLAVDRQQVVDIIGSGEWKLQGPVGGAITYWALPEDELKTFPGYRSSGAEREQDIQEARQLYEAAGSPELPDIWNADVPGYIPRFMSTYRETIRKNLGVEVKTTTHPYARIAEGLIKELCDQIPMGWGFDNGWIDLDDWVYPYFRTDAPKNSFKLTDPALDVLLDAQRVEFDADKRKALGHEIQLYLLGMDKTGKVMDPVPPGAHVRLDYASPAGPTVAWPYVMNRVSYPWFGNSFWSANIWFDKNDSSYQGRPA